LTIDTDLQKRVSNLLQKTLESSDTNAGVVVIQDPRTGAILSMVSLPTYDNKVMSNGVIGEEESALFDEWINDEHTPFLHRAISGVYPPGSTYKIVTASAALESGTVTVNDYIDSPGQIVIPSWFDPELTFIYKDWKPSGHGFLNVIEALEESSDTFFYKVSGGFEQIQGMGLLTLNDYARYYGVGSKLGVDLPQESAGVLPNEQWKQETIGEGWYVGDTYNMAIGQGYLLMTPLQVNTYTSVIANGGTVYKPHVVQEILNCDDQRSIEPEVIHTDFLTDDTIEAVRTGLRQVIIGPNGTAKTLRNLSVSVAGKTGTAQFNNNEQEHAWFTAYAPYDDPQIAITVLIEGGGEGSEVAVPLAGQIIEMYFADTE
jgi:penicillin-binding protein 2